jgi:hypothetical protein
VLTTRCTPSSNKADNFDCLLRRCIGRHDKPREPHLNALSNNS